MLLLLRYVIVRLRLCCACVARVKKQRFCHDTRRLAGTMSLATCNKFLRPSLSSIRPILRSVRLSGCRLFSSLEKRPNSAASRSSARHASDGNPRASSSEWPISDNGLLVLGFGLFGSSLFYVSIITFGDLFIRIRLHSFFL